MPPLSPLEIQTLDSLVAFLSSPLPYFEVSPPSAPRQQIDIIAVAGNWYDVPHKAMRLARAARNRPQATLLLTGGRAERLTPPEAVALGGEPMLLQSVLSENHGIEKKRMVVYTGSRITNHNLQAMLMFSATAHSYERRAVSLQLYEEAFLVRREAAALHVMMRRSDLAPAARALSSVRVRPVGPRTFAGLTAAHGGHADVALALVLGELSRLRSYSKPAVNSTSIDDVTLPAAAASLPDDKLRDDIERLWAAHRDGMLASGNALLRQPERLFAVGAAPK